MMRIVAAAALSAAVFAASPLMDGIAPDAIPQDRGSAGTWQKLLKLRTTASLMHTTAHPDDEHGGMLTKASRGDGARVSLLTLNRGESGDNAIGSELFDGLGLIRTEELLVADRYYGVDNQFFTTVVDYGFSKRLEEALDKWGREHVLRDVVRVIRMDRPLVLVSRFQGNQRDGHGNHQTAGLITQEAWKVAGDPNTYPDQIRDGLRPWQPLKLYMGGVRENEEWTVRVDTGEYSPALGDTFNNVARYGLSFQRSQTSGRYNPQQGPVISYYRRLDGPTTRETGFFDGIETRATGIFTVVGRPAPRGAQARLEAIDREVDAALAAFRMDDPSAAVPSLARGLRATREAIDSFDEEPEAIFLLRVKERQFEDAINTALAVDLSAVAQPAGVEEPTGPFAAFAPPPVMGPVVSGQRFEVRTSLTNRSRMAILPGQVSLESRGGFIVEGAGSTPRALNYNESAARRFGVTVGARAALSKPYFSRPGIQQDRYDVNDPSQLHRPAPQAALTAVARYTVDNVPVEIRTPVSNREAQLPYGYVMRELKVVPVVAVNVRPRQAIVPLAMPAKSVTVDVEIVNNKDEVTGTLALRVPAGWKSVPAQAPFTFSRAGEKRQYRFTVSVPSLENRDYRVEAVATVARQEYREGYDVIAKRDLETRYLYRPAEVGVRGIDVTIAPGLSVGYVMGIGDDVPSGIAQLGAKVMLLGEQDLASGDLRQYDVIMTGTRAYAVRDDLRTYNQRLLEYVRDGGNLIVLYNTQEFDPKRFAPHPGELTARAEEVSEEDSPVDLLAPNHPVFRSPNVITKADFDHWVEQRGSKFWSSWDKAYTPLIATYDQGQAPQQGGWLHARYGKGHYTYFAYAFHRQLPYGVPGAYRLLANLLSLNGV